MHVPGYYKSHRTIVDSTVPLSVTSSFARLAWAVIAAGTVLLAGCTKEEDMPTPVAGGHASIGKRLIAQYQCGACHVIPNVPGAGGEAGPSLEHIGHLSYIAGGIPNQPARMVAWLRDPPAQKPGTTMPALGVSEAEARHMAAYLYTLR
jgi:cytochrome c